MENQDLKELLMTDARNGGICADGYKEMRGYNREELIDYYLRTIDWSLERNFPSLKIMRYEFSNIEDKGVFVDRTFHGETFDKLQIYVFHHCKGVINVAMDCDNAVIPMLYFANGCEMEVHCEQDNFGNPIKVPLYIFGRNTVIAKSDEHARFVRYRMKMLK